jgi:hypothetical protein
MSDGQKQDKKCLLVSMAVIFISRIRAPCEVSDRVAIWVFPGHFGYPCAGWPPARIERAQDAMRLLNQRNCGSITEVRRDISTSRSSSPSATDTTAPGSPSSWRPSASPLQPPRSVRENRIFRTNRGDRISTGLAAVRAPPGPRPRAHGHIAGRRRPGNERRACGVTPRREAGGSPLPSRTRGP